MCTKKHYEAKIVFIALIGFIVIQSISADNVLKISSYTVQPNQTFTVQIEAVNSNPFVACQADIPIPNGFQYVNGSAQLNTARALGQALSANVLSGNILRLISYSVNNTAFTGTSGTIISFTLHAGTLPATYALDLNNAIMGDSQSNNLLTSTISGQVTVIAPLCSTSILALDFGRVALGTTAEQTFQISNSGNNDLIINSLSCNNSYFSTTESKGFTLSPSTNRTISVAFAPLAKGTFNKQLQIKSNDPNQPVISINLNATAYAVNEVYTGTMTGASSTTTTLDFSINNMEAFTGFQWDLVLPPPLTYVNGSARLFRTTDQTVNVNQLNNDTLRIVAFSTDNKNFTGKSGKILSLTFSLKGTGGTYPITINNVILADTTGTNIVSASYGEYLTITAPTINAPNQVDFGDVSTKSVGNQNIRIWNYGQEPLTITQLIFSSDNFKSNQLLPLTIQPSNYFDLPIQFSNSTRGFITGTLNIMSNDPVKDPLTVQLTAKAFVPNYIEIKPQSITAGDTIILPIEIENAEPFVAFQFDLTYPDGITPDYNNITLTNRKQDHVVAATSLSSNSMRILAYSPSQQSFTGQSGPVLTIPIMSKATLLPGSYLFSFNNALISNTQSQNILYSSVNGTIQVSPTTGLKTLTSGTVTVSPNPTTGKITINTNNESSTGTVKIEIFNQVGQLISIKKMIISGKFLWLDISTLHTGIYFLKFFINGKVYDSKVLKQ